MPLPRESSSDFLSVSVSPDVFTVQLFCAFGLQLVFHAVTASTSVQQALAQINFVPLV